MRRGRGNRARRSRGARRDRRRGALRGEPDLRPRGAPRVPRARRPLHARRVYPDGDPGGVARRRVAREAVSRRVARPRLHPRRPRAAAVRAARAIGRRDARERSRVDPRRRRCGERGRRAVARGAARPRERRRVDRAGAAAGDAGQSGAHMRAVTFGELLLRLSPPGDERLLESPELHTCFGGAEANVAVALSHLGVRCDHVTRVPDNPLGDAGVEALRKEGVGTRWIARGGGGERLGLYFVEPGVDLRAMRVVYDRAGSAFARLDPHSIDWPAVLAGGEREPVSAVTTPPGGGPGAGPPGATAGARARGTPVGLDLNYREGPWRNRDPPPPLAPP